MGIELTTVKGSALDTRLQHKLLLDPKLQRRLSGDEFRGFINLLVWSVSLVSDGVFHPDDAEMIIDREQLAALIKHGLIDQCEDTELCRIAPEYQEWQSSRAELEAQAAKRRSDRDRKRRERTPETTTMEPQEPWHQ